MSDIMEDRLGGIRNRFFMGKIDIVPIPGLATPGTLVEYLLSIRLSSAFSLLHETNETSGMTYEDALIYDESLNENRFGVRDPKKLIQQLVKSFNMCCNGNVSYEVLCKSKKVLQIIRDDSDLLSQTQSEDMHKVYKSDAMALSQVLGLIEELAEEFGMRL